MAKVKFKIEGIAELEKTFKKIGKLPQKCVNRASKAGSNIALKAARAHAPEDTGELKKGIIQKPEKTTKKGKKVHQVTFDAAKNYIFVKVSKEGKRSYYPASQEYGYMTKSGRYIPGFHYLRNALTNNAKKIERETVEVMSKEFDKLK